MRNPKLAHICCYSKLAWWRLPSSKRAAPLLVGFGTRVCVCNSTKIIKELYSELRGIWRSWKWIEGDYIYEGVNWGNMKPYEGVNWGVRGCEWVNWGNISEWSEGIWVSELREYMSEWIKGLTVNEWVNWEIIRKWGNMREWIEGMWVSEWIEGLWGSELREGEWVKWGNMSEWIEGIYE